MAIRDNIMRLMQFHKYNMKSLSKAAGLNETAIRDIIKGRVSSPRIITLEKISKALSCSVSDLIKD